MKDDFQENGHIQVMETQRSYGKRHGKSWNFKAQNNMNPVCGRYSKANLFLGSVDRHTLSYDIGWDIDLSAYFFYFKLRKMYPIKIDANGSPWKLPFLPGKCLIW